MSVAEIFSDAQRSLVSHRTLAKRLRRLENSPNFEAHVKQCVFRLLDVSKSEAAGTRVIKFLTTYLVSDDISNQISSTILLAVLPFLCAKDKTVRYRATQLTCQILGVLQAIDDDLYKVIRHELIKRMRDKVPAIRLEAVMALGRLVESEMEEEEEEDSDEDYAPGLLHKLLDALQNDTNADVRRALLVNLPATPKTLPYLLERARDRDAPTRRALYAKLLPKLGDFRHLSLSMREKLLRWGLRDRDERVRGAAARLFRECWIENCARTETEESSEAADEKEAQVGFYDPSIPALLELLERIDTLNTGNEDGVAREAMKDFWAGRPDYLDAVRFDDGFWDNLTPESAFIARTFNDYCHSDPSYREMIEEKMPEVTRLGFHLQKHINELVARVQHASESDSDEKIALQAEQEFIVEQLLYIAQSLDYTDEIGRRKMFSLLRHALSMAELPDECTRLTVEALRLVCNSDAAGEREFTSIVLEAIAEVHDNIASSDLEDEAEADEEDSFVSARSEVSGESTPRNEQAKSKRNKNLTEEEQEAKAIKEIVINMKCLHIAQCMLQNVAGNLQSNIDLRTMFDNLVIPAVRSHEALIRERGVQCLGLCCLLEPKLADENMRLFTLLLKRGHETLQVMALQILCDILLARGPPSSTHSEFSEHPVSPPATTEAGDDVTPTTTNNQSSTLAGLLSPFVKALSQTFPDEVRATSTASLCKLMLCGFYAGNEDLFDQIVERAIHGVAKGWELLEKVRNAVLVDRDQSKGKAADKSSDKVKERERSSNGVSSARTSNEGVGSGGERVVGESMEV
ncbi:uncharacterized protein A1O5_12349 [Cladophialophora psammophila CBS 110553]|uniref:Nuclear condensin complex subunit 3 C-terminal domain-containing protein n=1 Tax=Cladophialophora psammophila CBS 110553 TaxID=1182543 RepID=W9VZV0_9EURO|nr:uncharacterized protein A1O5_12349 [Cladophialophora psammophila CBS 110553]EXJ57791.1 hypothetical protein A1O5_12349 [Cladophialophora psammophila CBS 110553]